MAGSGSRNDPFGSFNFVIQVKPYIDNAGFSEVSGLSMTTDPIEYRNGDEKQATVRKIPGLKKWGNITLKRGFIKDDKLFKWRKTVLDGKTERASGTITLLDEAKNPVITWTFKEAWPSKLDGPTFNAKNNEIAIETLELVVEDLQMELAGG